MKVQKHTGDGGHGCELREVRVVWQGSVPRADELARSRRSRGEALEIPGVETSKNAPLL